MSKVEEIIKARKSTRNYSDRKVSADDLKTLAEAAIWAPNAMNKQQWHFSVVSDEKLLERMDAACKKGMAGAPVEFLQKKAEDPAFKAFFGAPAVIFISRKEDKFTAFDCGAAAEAICLLAKDMGLDTCVTAMTEFVFVGEPELKTVIGMPEDYVFTCAITVGYGAEGPDSHVRDRNKDVISYLM